MRQLVGKLLVRLPFVGPRYTRALLRAFERTPREKLTPELRRLQGMLAQMPEAERHAILRAALRGEQPLPEQQAEQQLPRSMRRAAEREARRRR